MSACQILEVLDFYGPTTMPVMELILGIDQDGEENLLQHLHYLEDESEIVVIPMIGDHPVRPIVFIERTG